MSSSNKQPAGTVYNQLGLARHDWAAAGSPYQTYYCATCRQLRGSHDRYPPTHTLHGHINCSCMSFIRLVAVPPLSREHHALGRWLESGDTHSPAAVAILSESLRESHHPALPESPWSPRLEMARLLARQLCPGAWSLGRFDVGDGRPVARQRVGLHLHFGNSIVSLHGQGTRPGGELNHMGALLGPRARRGTPAAILRHVVPFCRLPATESLANAPGWRQPGAFWTDAGGAILSGNRVLPLDGEALGICRDIADASQQSKRGRLLRCVLRDWVLDHLQDQHFLPRRHRS